MPLRGSKLIDAPRRAQISLVVFTVADRLMAVEINRIVEIIPAGPVTPIPHAPDYIPGLIDLRGVVVPVVDLRIRLSLPAGGQPPRHLMIVRFQRAEASSEGLLALLVQQAHEVAQIGVEEIKKAADLLRPETLPCLSGVCRHRNTLLLILDPGAIFSDHEIEIIGAYSRRNA